MKLAKLVLAAAVAASASTAMAGGSSAYIGLGGGQTNVKDWFTKSDAIDLMEAEAGSIGIDGFAGTESASIDDSDTAWKLFAGYQFHPNFAVELAYLDLGEVTAKANAAGVFCGGTDCFAGSANGSLKAEASAWTLDYIVKGDVTKWLGLFGRLGAYRADVEGKGAASITDGVDSLAESASTDGSNTGFHFGVGANFYITEAIAIRAEWERLNKVEVEEIDAESDIDVLSVSAIYRF